MTDSPNLDLLRTAAGALPMDVIRPVRVVCRDGFANWLTAGVGVEVPCATGRELPELPERTDAAKRSASFPTGSDAGCSLDHRLHRRWPGC